MYDMYEKPRRIDVTAFPEPGTDMFATMTPSALRVYESRVGSLLTVALKDGRYNVGYIRLTEVQVKELRDTLNEYLALRESDMRTVNDVAGVGA